MFSVNSCPQPTISPEWGRIDSTDCSKQTDADFPNPKMNFTVMMEYFDKQFNYTEDEVIHTLKIV